MADEIKGACFCGAVSWTFKGAVESATACNCTLCRRYGALWIYGHVGQEISIDGQSSFFERGRKINKFNFCTTCGCVTHYRANAPSENGLHRAAVNVRSALNPDQVAGLLIDHFDGFDTFEDLDRDGRCVKDFWF